MQTGKPSATAEMVCSWRALEATLPPEWRIVDDPFARGFLGAVRGGLVDGAAALPSAARRALLRRLDQALQGAVTFTLARHRAIDELIQSTPADQVVLLGVGYDTRSARLRERFLQSRVFEVDHPDTSRRRETLAAAAYGDVVPAPTVAVSIDFARESLEQRLLTAGLEPDARTIWVWEGVSMYLREQAVRGTLELFGRLSGRGSLAVCDLLSDRRGTDFLAGAQLRALGLAMGWVYSEPFLWHCPQDRIAEFFASCGLQVQEDLGMDELTGRYEERLRGWRESAPSLRLIISKPS